ncbi:NAD(P)H-dependent oxidoreductase [Helicobacter sp. faydin-H20]|uniref:NAD(P)H-dependent oxidoreductase n=1 Tax=Helicobacter anatolicus TaxID=2905874 RepID=UPI001E28D2B7|nr:NAD(P)H-dependent oxidoreductase [Helicobacter anatolicus]MCE3036702.1 NAD(P)H-dependent oxidoreductase [Helicobacter anatolicus]
MKDLFLQAMRRRFACKVFDSSKSIKEEDFEAILESARLTPSSFGLEPTRILVIKNQKLRQEIQPLCWNQKQITQADKLVILTSKTMDLLSQTHYTTKMFERKVGKDKQALIDYKDKRYKNFLESNGYCDCNSLYQWTSRQAYLMASSMINCASFLNIDSCPIEGFEKKALEKLLGLDPFVEQISLILTFGYHLETPSAKSQRLEKSELITYI